MNYTNSKPQQLIDATRSVWSARDETALNELMERRVRIMAERRAPLETLCTTLDATSVDRATDWMIENAETLRDLLVPFDGRIAR